MREIVAAPLTPAAFAPFGDVLQVPESKGRHYFEDALGNGRASAHASLSLSRAEPGATFPLQPRVMERHEFSSQSFVPLGPARWLVMVAPHGTNGGPDMRRAQAFLPGPGQGITYRMNVWHHPMTVIDAPAAFAVFMWLDGGKGDEEFVDVTEPLSVVLPG